MDKMQKLFFGAKSGILVKDLAHSLVFRHALSCKIIKRQEIESKNCISKCMGRILIP